MHTICVSLLRRSSGSSSHVQWMPSGEVAPKTHHSPPCDLAYTILYRAAGSDDGSMNTSCPTTPRARMLLSLFPANSTSFSDGFSQWMPSAERA
jgi:hypothetical protein